MNRVKPLFFIVFFVLNACSFFDPAYKKPKVDVPAEWSNKAVKNTTVNFPELAWWKQYQDPELNAFMQAALKYNNNIHLAAANLEYAQAQLKQVQLNWIPGMNIFAGYSQMPNLGDPGTFFGIWPLYAINIMQQIKQQENAEYNVEVSAYQKDGVRLTVIGQVAGSYFTLLAQEESLKLYQQLVAYHEKLVKLYQQQYRAGIIAQDQLDAENRDIQQIKAQMAVVQHNIVVSKNALCYLMNHNPHALHISSDFNKIDSSKIIPGSLPVTVLAQRPDVQQAEASIKAANANRGVAASNLLPSIRLDVFNGYASSFGDNDTALNEAYANIPVINAPVIGQVQASQAQYKAAYIAYVDTVRRALRDVENDLSAYTAYSTQLQENTQALLLENKRCELVASRYRHGIDSEVQVLQCQIQRNTVQWALNQYKLQKMMTIVLLYQDLGGGYREVLA